MLTNSVCINPRGKVFPALLLAPMVLLLLGLPSVTSAAASGEGPSMIIAAAQEAAHADALIGECRYDEAEHWIKEAVRSARDARSANALERDVAGSAVGQMNIKLDEFQRQRKAWDHAAADARHLLNTNHIGMARKRLDQAPAPACDERFTELRNEIANLDQRATALVRKGDDQSRRYPRTARNYYLEAVAIDADRADLQQKLLDVDQRIPGYCQGCMPQR